MDSDNGDRQGYSKGGGAGMIQFFFGIIIGFFVGVLAISLFSLTGENKASDEEIEAWLDNLEKGRRE